MWKKVVGVLCWRDPCTPEPQHVWCLELNREKEELLHTTEPWGDVIRYKKTSRQGCWGSSRSRRQVELVLVGPVSVTEWSSGHKHPEEKDSAHSVNIQTWTRGKALPFPSESYPGKTALPFSPWVCGSGVLYMDRPMSTVHISSELHVPRASSDGFTSGLNPR